MMPLGGNPNTVNTGCGISVLNGGVIPPTLLEESSLPPFYHKAIVSCGALNSTSLPNTAMVYNLMITSGLHRSVLANIWSLVNRTWPGQLTRQEFFSCLVLIALFQRGQSLGSLSSVSVLPIPEVRLCETQLGNVSQIVTGKQAGSYSLNSIGSSMKNAVKVVDPIAKSISNQASSQFCSLDFENLCSRGSQAVSGLTYTKGPTSSLSNSSTYSNGRTSAIPDPNALNFSFLSQDSLPALAPVINSTTASASPLIFSSVPPNVTHLSTISTDMQPTSRAPASSVITSNKRSFPPGGTNSLYMSKQAPNSVVNNSYVSDSSNTGNLVKLAVPSLAQDVSDVDFRLDPTNVTKVCKESSADENIVDSILSLPNDHTVESDDICFTDSSRGNVNGSKVNKSQAFRRNTPNSVARERKKGVKERYQQ